MGIERNEEVVTDAGATPDDTNTNPNIDGGGNSGGKDENRIPISRAEEMWARREEKLKTELRREWEDKELNPVRQRYEADQKRLADAELARLKAMGWLQDEQPKPITQDQLDKILNERMDKQREEQLQYFYTQRITDGWREVSRKYPALVNRKSFQSAVLAMYAENPNVDFVAIADEAAKEYDAYYTDKEAASQKERENRRSPANRIVPSGRGAAGGGREGGGKGEGKRSVSQKILDRLRATNE